MKLPAIVNAEHFFPACRCVDAEAFEVNKDDLSNGIFISFLKKRLMEPEKVTVMLDRVAEGSRLSFIFTSPKTGLS